MATDEVQYEPNFDYLADLSIRLGADTGLVLGEPDEASATSWRGLIPDLRFTTARDATRYCSHLPIGIYAAKTHGLWRLLLVPREAQAAVPARQDRLAHLADDWDPLVIAADLCNSHWEMATQITDAEVWPGGTQVLISGTSDLGSIVASRRLEDFIQYTVDVRGVRKTITSTQLQLLPGDMNDPHVWMALPPATSAEVALTIAWTKLRHPLTEVLYSFQASRTLFRPYQFKPVLKMIEGDEHRLLIADEVGLGKTIEAGLIWSELEGRSPLDRVLILCPAALTVKWQTEMELRFDRKLHLLNKKDWENFFEALERGDRPVMMGVDSIERLRVTDVPDRLISSGARYDLVVIDEAHKLRNAGNRTHALGEALSDAADALVLLTATPVNLGNRDLYTLLSILDEAKFNDIALFELESEPNAVINKVASLLLDGDSTPIMVRENLLQLKNHPVGRSIIGRPDAQQLLAMLDTTENLSPREVSKAKKIVSGLGTFSTYITRTRKADVPDAKAIRTARTLRVQWTDEEQHFYKAVRDWVGRRARATGTHPGFAEQMPLRQTASCIPAMAERIRINANAASRADSESSYFLESGIDNPEDDELVPHINLPVPAVDSKFEMLLEGLDQMLLAGIDQVMIFSYFRLTLGYLDRELGRRNHAARVMHGGVSIEDREHIMRDFRAGKFRILLISEVGSEGLDFEFCGALVNYDLPWNPMRVEQRIGRLDRFGQAHEKILIYNFLVEGTIEDRILLRRYERIGIFERSIGELEPIISKEIEDLIDVLTDARLTSDEQETRIRRIEVALANKESQIDELRANEGSLMQLDRVLIDGFENDNPGGGRFIGPNEFALVLQDLIDRTQGSMTINGAGDKVTLQGSTKLAALLRDFMRRESSANPGRLIQHIHDSTPVEVALVPATAENGIQLLSVRHPLIRIASEQIRLDPLALKRFGHISLSPKPTTQYLAVLSLVEGRGTKNFLRLEPTAVDMEGLRALDLESELLQAFSIGRVFDAALKPPTNVTDMYEVAQRMADLSRVETERELMVYDASLVSARRSSLIHSADIKINATRKRLEMAIDIRIRRMQEGRIRNLESQLATKLQDLDGGVAMVTTEIVAVLLIDR